MGFNQLEYIKQYNKENYKQFKVNLKLKEYEKLESILKANNMSKAEFLKYCIENFKSVSEK